MDAARDLPQLIDSFEGDDEVSIVRLRVRVSWSNEDEADPAPVSCSMVVERFGVTSRRTYFLGTRFPLGVIQAEDWRDAMRQDGVDEATLDHLGLWLESVSL